MLVEQRQLAAELLLLSLALVRLKLALVTLNSDNDHTYTSCQQLEPQTYRQLSIKLAVEKTVEIKINKNKVIKK